MPNQSQPHYSSPNLTFPNEINHILNVHSNEAIGQKPSPPEGYPVSNAQNNEQTKRQGVNHFSHPHPLLVCHVQEDDPVICSCCEQGISDGLIYSCTILNCNFYLHKSCFDLPSEIQHKSHPQHAFKLLGRSSYKNGEFCCNACCENGKGFVYNCLVCKYDLHVDCASLPASVKRDDHDHPLRLLYTDPITHMNIQQEGMTFSCDVCKEVVQDGSWSYLCQDCDFGTHLGCINSAVSHGGRGGGGSGGGGGGGDFNFLDKYQQHMQNMQALQMMSQMIANSRIR